MMVTVSMSIRRLIFVGFTVLLLLPACKEGQRFLGQGPEIVEEAAFAKTLEQLSGKVVLLDFWATWCPPCRAEIPHELELHRHFNGRPFAILGVSVDEKRDELNSFLEKNSMPWTNVHDAGGQIAKKWGVGPIPTFILLDQHGNILHRWVGGGQSDQIRASIDNALRAVERK